MKKAYFNALIMMLLITPPCVVAQNDAFFYENFETMNREGSTGFSFDNFSEGGGIDFGIFGNNGDGLDFGDFEYEGDDVSLDGGLLLLCGFAMLRLKSKDKRL